jgi:hypothetical protein
MTDRPNDPANAFAARIVAWNGKLGVGYTYDNGKREAHPIHNEDWPIIDRLEHAGKLTYTNDRVRELAAKLRENDRR